MGQALSSRAFIGLCDVLFISALTGLYLISAKKQLNYFQSRAIYILAFGVVLRIILLSVDYWHIATSGQPIMEHQSDGDRSIAHMNRDFLVGFFIRTPNIFFQFPLFAFCLDWVELYKLIKLKI